MLSRVSACFTDTSPVMESTKKNCSAAALAPRDVKRMVFWGGCEKKGNTRAILRFDLIAVGNKKMNKTGGILVRLLKEGVYQGDLKF